MVYSYANWLSERGHGVSIMFMNMESLKKLPGAIRSIALKLSIHLRPRWFKLNKRIRRISYSADTKRWEDGYKDDFDCVIATELKTAAFVDSHFDDAKKLYFIQDFENWDCSDEEVYATYRMNMKKIVISEWLKEIVDKYSLKPSVLIRNPIDRNIYCVKNNIEERSPFSIGMLYHEGDHKGCKYAVEALKKVKKNYPDVLVDCFGTTERPADLPDWFIYTRDASQDETAAIYNKVAIWVCASVEEGFGLTGLEAMSCGAALVSTEYKGVKEYAVNEDNALLSPIRDSESLAGNISRLIDNREERIRIAKSGIKKAEEFSIEKAVDSFERMVIVS